MAQDLAGFVQNLPKRQRNESQVGGESFALRLRECSQQVISVEIVGAGHGDCHPGLQGCGIQSQSIVQSPSPLFGGHIALALRCSIPRTQFRGGLASPAPGYVGR